MLVSLQNSQKYVGSRLLLRKVTPLEFFRRKFDEFINRHGKPPITIRLHKNKLHYSLLGVLEKEHDLGHLEIKLDLPVSVPGIPDPIPNPNFEFNDLNSDRVTLNVTVFPASVPPRLEKPQFEVKLHFETQGTELIINNAPNVDFRGLNITIRITLGAQGLVRVYFPEVIVNADVDVELLPDGLVARKIEEKVSEGLRDALGKREVHDAINPVFTRFILGEEYEVYSVQSNGQFMIVEYFEPPAGTQINPFPELPQPPLEMGMLTNIDHIVVLMMENRSFDHMLGYLQKTRPQIDGLKGDQKILYKGREYRSFPLSNTLFAESPCHDHDCIINQINGGKMDGFVADFAARFEAKGINPGNIMGYYDGSKVPVYDALAREFLVCNRWFCAHPGPTWPNRFYTVTGRLNRDAHGRWEYDNPDSKTFSPVETKTIFDHLTEQGVSWHYYEHGYCFLRLFSAYTTDIHHIVNARDSQRGFFAAARAGTLPSVSFLDPDFIDLPPGNDDHPPADIAAGQHFIAEVVRALMEGPRWQKTLLVITYDEHGGFFDHVPPPNAVPVSGIDRYGVRVPTFVISPWVQRGGISGIVFDHTSILKTIVRRFLSKRPPDLGERVAAANDLSMVFQSAPRQDKPTIPLPPAPAALDSEAIASLIAKDDRDFHALLRAVRAKYQVRLLV